MVSLRDQVPHGLRDENDRQQEGERDPEVDAARNGAAEEAGPLALEFDGTGVLDGPGHTSISLGTRNLGTTDVVAREVDVARALASDHLVDDPRNKQINPHHFDPDGVGGLSGQVRGRAADDGSNVDAFEHLFDRDLLDQRRHVDLVDGHADRFVHDRVDSFRGSLSIHLVAGPSHVETPVDLLTDGIKRTFGDRRRQHGASDSHRRVHDIAGCESDGVDPDLRAAGNEIDEARGGNGHWNSLLFWLREWHEPPVRLARLLRVGHQSISTGIGRAWVRNSSGASSAQFN